MNATETAPLNTLREATETAREIGLGERVRVRAPRNSLADAAALEAEAETRLIESDPDLHARILERASSKGESVPAEEALNEVGERSAAQ